MSKRLVLSECPKVQVMKLAINEVTRRSHEVVLHEGYQVGQTSTHLRVWNPAKGANDGSEPEQAELYAKSSPRVWCVVTPPKEKKK